MSHNEIMTAVFPIFQQHIEPHLVHAHVSLVGVFMIILIVVSFFDFAVIIIVGNACYYIHYCRNPLALYLEWTKLGTSYS